ncbi:Hypothetical predicted protein [Octopus vulgaris]|uniref:Uncharacterized protein n=1 Tax=Octopus vulgaris TaxID=6645 RepID=A0AA36BGM7_OCTVU|nr:Hypothetical predicted protein [Octopus vulgaris]
MHRTFALYLIVSDISVIAKDSDAAAASVDNCSCGIYLRYNGGGTGNVDFAVAVYHYDIAAVNVAVTSGCYCCLRGYFGIVVALGHVTVIMSFSVLAHLLVDILVSSTDAARTGTSSFSVKQRLLMGTSFLTSHLPNNIAAMIHAFRMFFEIKIPVKMLEEPTSPRGTLLIFQLNELHKF